jgi:Zn-dependent M32 family carboxypeptidase
MVKIYCKRIMSGLMKLDDVPTLWRNKVEEALENTEEKSDK